ncbi:MAG: sugar phosphate isomerase/epimerase [Anaerolineales bacterium]|nr:sugar phosphate isomerase/epimerase [Anaerolineales bacterium]
MTGNFRIGTTSYIVDADLDVNAAYLADKVRDMELVLFDVENGPCNFPAPETVSALQTVATQHDFSYTVHLPLDIRLADDGSADHVSLRQAKRVIALTRALRPFAYVLHLDGRSIQSPDTTKLALQKWQDSMIRALELLAEWVGNPALLAVENLEGYALDLLPPITARVPVSRCVDIGHLWLDGHDPLPYLQAALPRTRVVHMHGLAGRAHQSLAHMLPAQIDPVLRCLQTASFAGVLTLEVFGEADFASSLAALHDSLLRIGV